MLLITTTHNRPKAFAALEKWVEKQTYTDWKWLVVTDGSLRGYKFNLGQEVVERDDVKDYMPSINHNYLEALNHLGDEKEFVILEDDDWYCEKYLFEMSKLLKKNDLVGFENDAYYYVLNRRAKRWLNRGHASLAATAFTDTAVEWVKTCILKGDPFIDRWIWRGWKEEYAVEKPDGSKLGKERHHHFEGKRILLNNFTGLPEGQLPKIDKHGNVTPAEYPRHVGLKTNWHGGADGISTHGHKPDGSFDIWGKTLEKWLGEDASFYLSFTKPVEYGSPQSTGQILPDPNWDPHTARF